MPVMIMGSMCLTELIAQAKAGHSAFTKAANGKIYFNFVEWINEEPDKYGNHSSYRLNSKKEKIETEPKVYFGNGKVNQREIQSTDLDVLDTANIQEQGEPHDFDNIPPQEEGDDLPF